MKPITFVGLGNMGLPMSLRLARHGYPVTAFDVAASARAGAAAEGLDVIESIDDVVAETSTLLLMLPSSAVVEKVLIAGNVLDRLPRGACIIDMGSSNPTETRRLSDMAHSGGRRFVDAPVSGGVSGARNGTLTIMVGGEPDEVEAARPTLEVLGSQVRHVGPAGAGHALKALNNLLSATHLLISSEAMLVGREFGLDFQTMLAVINTSSGRSGSTEVKWPSFVLPQTYDSGFSLALMAKDMRIAVELADELGWPTALGHAATTLWTRAADAMPVGADHTEIVEWLKQDHESGSGT